MRRSYPGRDDGEQDVPGGRLVYRQEEHSMCGGPSRPGQAQSPVHSGAGAMAAWVMLMLVAWPGLPTVLATLGSGLQPI